jgi:LPS sulfotransferase NodH
MLATTAGAGGSYLAAALAAACGMTGVEAEIFNPRGPVQHLKAAHQVALFSEYLRSIAEQPGPYGIFAASWPDFSIFSRLYRQMFPDLKIIYLDRLDVVAQGVAAWRTGISAAAETAFDPQTVCDLIDTIDAETQAWKRLFETEGLQPLRLSYEGFADDTAAAVRYIGEHFGLTLNAEIGPEMGSLLAADSQNEEWMEQVRDYRSGRGGKLP